LFAMLGTSAVLVGILWYRLGSSAEYHEAEPEQAIESKTIDPLDEQSRPVPRKTAVLEDDVKARV
jgi:hypothetical protein